MLVDGVTINDGKDSPAGLCATPICVNKRIAEMAIKAVEAVRPVGMPHYSTKPTRAWMSGRSTAAVATSREGQRSPRSDRAVLHGRLDYSVEPPEGTRGRQKRSRCEHQDGGWV